MAENIKSNVQFTLTSCQNGGNYLVCLLRLISSYPKAIGCNNTRNLLNLLFLSIDIHLLEQTVTIGWY